MRTQPFSRTEQLAGILTLTVPALAAGSLVAVLVDPGLGLLIGAIALYVSGFVVVTSWAASYVGILKGVLFVSSVSGLVVASLSVFVPWCPQALDSASCGPPKILAGALVGMLAPMLLFVVLSVPLFAMHKFRSNS